ncbi:MAG: glutamate-5-semialdehyde dehydrogenase [Chlorobium limicola]|jgi:glutamate-5-semialdehyde dehydrogenase|uniref:Gamma-glutamyl phosphate reductase n=1 Tax=Chlorobium limicola (strain DSM 245 / NBRC 103803 / 6330) TaxID=290315 RepID=PROA_CHLL2|nr:glutamate-5-semialdehyde dehydrogenase [Chlorobium limicola]B3EE24.1 RecName: Full=Gamma-glutamyl phosphate reductase; Short=GPR; AltName: Full=Glutamate-5-semialdehyde dehydrogenase; AltName: Full=Glutamyl-gamma-semialdehyde dehydrogenase; Short=GSA dehydrogenase [Chlorobium limicola DSM 245]ACD90726.1 gamma-glutamyl phosphate reductase [Chlorobium limicola DSM 245]NTV07034.1 glutamate-5-semialdehyde dehydrogenase [Chlorobium limicola]
MQETIRNTFKSVRQASRELVMIGEQAINSILIDLAETIPDCSSSILEANRRDLDRMDPADPMFDRLLLNEKRLEIIAADIRNVATLPSPLDIVLEQRRLPNGLELKKITVPIGVIGIIYEARPNVTFDVFALCLKSGNATVLKGGSDAHESNTAIVECIKTVLRRNGINDNTLSLLPSEREAAGIMLNAVDSIDMIIPRGSQKLIDFVRQNAKVPVIETGAGIVHTYIDKNADTGIAAKVIFNAKTRRPSVCNALDTLLVHAAKLDDLPQITAPLQEKKVVIYADEAAYAKLQGSYPESLLERARPEHFGTEFLSLKLSVKTVSSIEEALDHIAEYSSRHSEAIITNDPEAKAEFLKRVDAAVVYANTSTAFTDGAQFGLGAEIGISTQKLHARGPMALKELTSYKWIIEGDGQTRSV